VCARPLAPAQRADRVCAAPGCRRTWFVGRWWEPQRREREALESRARARREQAAPAAGVERPDDVPVTITPSFRGALVRLPQRRRRALRAHLARIAAAALERRAGARDSDAAAGRVPAGDRGEASDATGDVLRRACANCRGFCCRTGGEHAYLSAEDIERQLAAHPEQGADDAVAAYLACVGPVTRVGSCVYHGRAGCTLPRTMRSDTCNRFLCDALLELRREVHAGRPPPAFLAAAHDGAIEAAAFVGVGRARVARAAAAVTSPAPEQRA
jgi:hypothetical protein